jgi:hypothetical protein
MVDEIKHYARRHPNAKIVLAGASEEELKDMQGRLGEYSGRVTLALPRPPAMTEDTCRALLHRYHMGGAPAGRPKEG